MGYKELAAEVIKNALEDLENVGSIEELKDMREFFEGEVLEDWADAADIPVCSVRRKYRECIEKYKDIHSDMKWMDTHERQATPVEVVGGGYRAVYRSLRECARREGIGLVRLRSCVTHGKLYDGKQVRFLR